MNFKTYYKGFEDILNNDIKSSPYDNSDYLEYTKLNFSRLKRWLKNGVLNEELIKKIKAINENQEWIIITEHWCGDAAHSVPFFAKLAEINPLVNLSIQLRDSNSEIDSYLTNGGKSIPIFIIRNSKGVDLFIWGPRPNACQTLFLDMKSKNLPFEEQKEILQNWYNIDKGNSLQKEFLIFFVNK